MIGLILRGLDLKIRLVFFDSDYTIKFLNTYECRYEACFVIERVDFWEAWCGCLGLLRWLLLLWLWLCGWHSCFVILNYIKLKYLGTLLILINCHLTNWHLKSDIFNMLGVFGVLVRIVDFYDGLVFS